MRWRLGRCFWRGCYCPSRTCRSRFVSKALATTRTVARCLRAFAMPLIRRRLLLSACCALSSADYGWLLVDYCVLPRTFSHRHALHHPASTSCNIPLASSGCCVCAGTRQPFPHVAAAARQLLQRPHPTDSGCPSMTSGASCTSTSVLYKHSRLLS